MPCHASAHHTTPDHTRPATPQPHGMTGMPTRPASAHDVNDHRSTSTSGTAAQPTASAADPTPCPSTPASGNAPSSMSAVVYAALATVARLVASPLLSVCKPCRRGRVPSRGAADALVRLRMASGRLAGA
ncbi:hypothetical protein BKA80DRAFT_250650 [Phyllosticta citrichinensis]